jgi:hypothetical protein
MKLSVPYIEKIWRAEGEVPLDEALTPAEAFARLDPLFQTPGTTYVVEGDTLTYAKHNPAAQDKLATFTHGTLRLVKRADGTSWMAFKASSKALLLCFLAPLLFLAFAQIMTVANGWEKAASEAEQAAGKSKDGDKDKDKDEAKPVAQLHPLDQMLGAPAPEDPSKKKGEKKDEPKEKFRTTPAYVLAGLFFVVFLVGRVLEPWLLKRTLRAALAARSSDSECVSDPAGLCSGTI